MSVSKRKGSPHYWYDFTVGGMRFRGSCETNDIATAKAVEAQLRTDAVLNKHLRRKPRITLDAAFAKYWQEHGQYTRTGLSSTQLILRELLSFFRKDIYLDEIDDRLVNELVAHLQRRSKRSQTRDDEKSSITYLSNSSINRKIDMLRAVILQARSKWGVETSEVNISKHRLRIAEARTRWITAQEADKLVFHAADHIKPIIRCALLTGLRLSNITGLSWEQVNMHSRIISLRVKSKLPGGKRLEIPISDTLFNILLEQGPQKTGHVFVRKFKNQKPANKPRKPEPLIKIRKAFVHACTKAGIKDFRFHDLRHTAASWMIQNGVPLDVVQQILGHSDISTTQKYAHRQAADRLAAMDKLAAAQEIPTGNAADSRHIYVTMNPKEKTNLCKPAENGAAERNRTSDPVITNDVLYH
jgi:integrase